jgi:hypothetical protein
VFGRRDPDERATRRIRRRFIPETLVAPVEELTTAYFGRGATEFIAAPSLVVHVRRITPLMRRHALAGDAASGWC